MAGEPNPIGPSGPALGDSSSRRIVLVDSAALSVRPGSASVSRGTNQTGVRLYNERLVLSQVRENQTMPKADIARRTGLSPRTISIIVNQLTADGLLLKGRPQRGRVGQPSVPYS